MRRHTPLRSIGEPEDIAAAVLYLASDASRFMTGQVVRPNGGVAMALRSDPALRVGPAAGFT